MFDKNEIIEMARQAGMEQDGENFFSCNHDEIDVHITDLTAFAKLVAAKEREACAKIVESDPSYDFHKFACEAAYAIRARSGDEK